MNQDINKEIGDRIKGYRKEMHLTQDQMVEKLKHQVSRSTYTKWETGRQSLIPEQIVMLADVFGIDAHMLLTGNERANQTVATELGLCDTAVDYLKSINHDSNIALRTVNSLLETKAGRTLLELIGKYVFANFQQGYVEDKDNYDQYGNPKKINCDTVFFQNESASGVVDLSLNAMRVIFLEVIKMKCEELKREIEERTHDVYGSKNEH